MPHFFGALFLPRRFVLLGWIFRSERLQQLGVHGERTEVQGGGNIGGGKTCQVSSREIIGGLTFLKTFCEFYSEFYILQTLNGLYFEGWQKPCKNG